MPFIKKTNTKSLQSSTNARTIFIGRTNESDFFVQQILKPEDPAYNIISVSGQGGVGKSTLLARFIDEANASNFKDYCLTVIVNERQTTPASIMEKFADQLREAGFPLSKFEEALTNYKDALRKMQMEREVERDALFRKAAPDIAGSVVKSVPVVGGFLGEGVKVATGYILDEYRYRQQLKDAEQLEDPIGNLTRAFVEELNHLTEIQATSGSNREKRRRRVLLFFDTFELLAAEAAPWLLDYFLEANINSNVVLVIAGREPIGRSISDDPKRWLPYHDSQTIYSILLDSFTEDETRDYLVKRRITDPLRITTIWQLSRGLPLYLSLLTSSQLGEVDPEKGVVDNFLRWIPKSEEIKRRLAIDAALLSRPFNQDDLAAFTYLPEHERSNLYRWLTELPFVRYNLQDGRHSYHELAQELFSRYLYQLSPDEYRTTRIILADYYRHLLEKVEIASGKEVYDSTEWEELTLALACQLFLLPDEISHIKAIEQVLNVYGHVEQTGEIVRFLRKFSQAHSGNLANAGIQQTAKQILQYIETNLKDEQFIASANYLIAKVSDEPSFSAELLASLYGNLGEAHRIREEYLLAIADFDYAIQLEPKYAWAYGSRGQAYFSQNEYQLALADFDLAIELDPKLDWVYGERGNTYLLRNEYQLALADFNRVLELKPDNIWAYLKLGLTYTELKNFQQAITNFDRIIEQNLNDAGAYNNRGNAYFSLQIYQRAIADFDRVLELYPNDPGTYNNRGLAYANLQNYEKAISDYNRALQLDSHLAIAYNNRGLVYANLQDYDKAIADYDQALKYIPNNVGIFSNRCLAYISLQKYEQAIDGYNQIIKLDPNNAEAYNNRGSAFIALEKYQQALEDFDRALVRNSKFAWAFAERGRTYRLLQKYGQAIKDFDRALELDPKLAWAYAGRGIVYRNLENLKRAIKDFDKALELDPKLAWAYGSRGQAYFSLQKYWQAIEDFDKALELDPKLAWVYSCRGRTYNTLKDFERATQDFDKALELDPKLEWAYGSRGIVHRNLEEYDLAIKDFDKALELDPKLAWVYGSRGQAYFSLQKYWQAIEDFDKAIELDPKLAWAHGSRGRTYINLKKYQRAIKDYDRALELDTQLVWALAGRGIAYRNLEEYDLAIKDFDKALELDPKLEWVYGSRGQAYFSLNEHEQAIEAYSITIELNPKLAWAYATRGRTYCLLQKYGQAIKDFDRALQLDSQNAWALAGRGIVYRNLEEYDLAIKDFDKALELDPKLAWVYGSRGRTYLLLQDILQAKADFVLSWELDQTNVNIGWMKEWSDICQEKTDLRMADRLEMIATINPRLYEAHICRAVAHWLNKRFEEALIELEDVISLEQNSIVSLELSRWDAYFWKGMICACLKQDDGALRALKKAISIGLPLVLLNSLRWLIQNRPDFYKKHVDPLLTGNDLFRKAI